MSRTEIKILMIRKGVKQADIAKQLRVTPTTVCNVIKGVGESSRVKHAISKACGCKVEDIIWTVPGQLKQEAQTVLPEITTKEEDLII